MIFSIQEILRLRFLFAPADEPAGGDSPAETPNSNAPEGQVDLDEGITEGEVSLTAEDLQKAGLSTDGTDPDPEDGDDPADPDAPATRTRNRSGGKPASARIRQLTSEKRAEAARSRELEAALAASERTRQELEQKHSKTEAATFGYYKEATKAHLATARSKLIAAKETGDAAAEADAQIELNKYSADWRDIENWEAANPKADPAKPVERERPREQARERPAQRQEQHPDTADWIAANPYFQIDNKREFDREMHEEAALVGSQLERKYNRMGKPELVGSREYFDQIDKHMRAEFPDYEWTEPAPRQATTRTRQMPQMQGRDNVANSTRQAPATQNNGTGLGNGATKITLNAEERGMARRMGLKHPGTNRPLSDAEHEKVYALNKLRQQQEDAKNPREDRGQ
jgi:hypothetical protein